MRADSKVGGNRRWGPFDGTHLTILTIAAMACVIGTTWAAGASSSVPPAKGNAAYLGGYPASDYRQDVFADVQTKPMTVTGDGKLHDVLDVPYRNSALKPAGILDFADVQIRNLDKQTPTVVTLRVRIGKDLEDATYSATIAPTQTQSLTGVIRCDGVPRGRATIHVLISSTGSISLGTRADEGLRPIVVPPGSRTFGASG